MSERSPQVALSEWDLLWLVLNECDGEVVIDAEQILKLPTGWTLSCQFSDDQSLLVITASTKSAESHG